MGLDAVVYLHRDNLPLNVSGFPNIDDETGEIYFEDPKLAKQHPADLFTAIHKNLGNIAMIAALRAEVGKVLKGDTVLSDKILYNGSHSGDIIGLDELADLELEINLVRKRTVDKSADLESLLDSLSELVEAARTQRNPIVFV
jgi:hypothetical protein